MVCDANIRINTYITLKLCCIYVNWGDWDLLRMSISNIRPHVESIILICSEYSNYGEKDESFRREFDLGISGISHFQIEPDKNMSPVENETRKRNYGLEVAKRAYGTHFLISDSDEFYEPEPFLKEKQRFIDNPNLAGLVCRSQVYFKSPTLTIGLDTTLVPFIHKITPGIMHQFNRKYPFAWTNEDGKPFTEKKRIRIDPTRSLNINSGVEWSEIIMHHYSYVRRDLDKKIRNSTARGNLKNSTIVRDFEDAKEGGYCQFYGKQLARCPNLFGLPEM